MMGWGVPLNLNQILLTNNPYFEPAAVQNCMEGLLYGVLTIT